jgi:DnaJ-class molecular chaperone
VQFVKQVDEPVVISTRQRSPHEVLFVTSNAPPEVVLAAYRALAKKHHPDHGGDEEKFKEIDAAYRKLKL